MNAFLRQLAPSVTNLIRLDHTQALATFHQYDPTASGRFRRGIADNVCLQLEIHAQLEEEIFYPVLRLVLDDDAMKKAQPEHDELRTLIARLKQMVVTDPTFDHTFNELMRQVMHHVAEEETTLLPAAERLLPQQLTDLGAQMARRRLQLTASRGGEFAGSLARSLSLGTVLASANTLLSGASLLTRRGDPTRSWTRPGRASSSSSSGAGFPTR
ncbi:hemerythrin domain-containing protein [Ramlibacter sp.]|uniref:hemerythrin domain-containing protein n=1 Tax=Ramlibacter sp. TaxID=1917967 RepID=UPI003D09618A